MVKTAEINGFEMDYAVFGNSKKAFVILPGISLKSVTKSADAVAEAYKQFSDEYSIYIFDPVRKPHEGYTIKKMADDTALVMKSLGIKDAVIFGASQGGMATLQIAVDYPELAGKIIVGSSMARENEKSAEFLGKMSALAKQGKTDELTEYFADMVYSENTLGLYRDVIISGSRDFSKEELERFTVMADACKGFNVYDELEKIKCPVLVLGSEGDKVLSPQASEEIAEKLGCEIYMYDESYGHCVFDEAADYKDRIMKFITE